MPAKCGRFSQREGCTNGSSERSGIVGNTQCVLASWLIKVIIKICLCLADWPSSILSRTYPGLRLNSSSSSTSFFYEFNYKIPFIILLYLHFNGFTLLKHVTQPERTMQPYVAQWRSQGELQEGST